MCLVSVLVPIYGVEQYIERCARSLFEQTYPNIEFVFVNDCTRDRSVEILMQVLKDYPHRAEMVKLINHDSNRGIASTRNTALENATGEFVFYVDSDDWTEIEAIESLVKKQKETNADIVSGNMYIHSHQGVTKFFQPEYDGKEQMILMQFPSTHDHDLFRRIVRRSLFEDHCIRCIEGCNMAEDRYIMVQLCFYAKMVSVIDDFVYHYNSYNTDSYTHQFLDEKKLLLLEQGLTNWIEIRNFLLNKEMSLFYGTTEFVVIYLQGLMNLSLKLKNKYLYRKAVKFIHENEDCKNMIKWDDIGLRNRLKHNYYYMLLKGYKNILTNRLCA